MATRRRPDAGARTRNGRASAPPVLLLSAVLTVAGIALAGVASAGIGSAGTMSGGIGSSKRSRPHPTARASAAVRTDSTTPAAAHVGVDVGTDPRGAHVELGRDRSWVEVGPVGGRGHGGATSGCHRRWVPAKPVLLASRPHPIYLAVLPPTPSPDAKPYFVYCDATFVSAIWATPSQFGAGDPTAAAHALAERLVRDLPFPRVGIGISPAARGLTGLESWYWVTGYDGAPITAAVSAFGVTVTVEARPAHITWDFGDGDPVRSAGGGPGGLGTPSPARSSVTHTYEHRSGPGGFGVEVRFQLDTRYRIGTGPWAALAPVERSAGRVYPVDESRAQLQASSP